MKEPRGKSGVRAPSRFSGGGTPTSGTGLPRRALETRPQGYGPDLTPAPRAPAPDRAPPAPGLQARASRAPRARRGRWPRSQTCRLDPSRRTAATPRHRAPARLSAPCPWPNEGHPERSEPAGGRGREHSQSPGSDLSPANRRPASALGPPHSPRRGREPEKEVGGVPEGRSLPVSSSPILFGSMAGSASTPSAIFLTGRRQGLLRPRSALGVVFGVPVFSTFRLFCLQSLQSSV